MSKTDSTMTVQFTWAEKFNILKPYFSDRFMEQVKNVWLIITYLVLFQIIVLGLPIVDSLMIGVGIGIVIVGLMFFMEGLTLGLMPFGETIGASLPQKAGLPIILGFAFILGMGATFAEPAIATLQLAGRFVDPQQAPLLYSLLNEFAGQLVASVGVGVGIAVIFGVLRFLYGWSLKYLIYPLVFLLSTLTLYAHFNEVLNPVIGLAWDCGAVTTGPVTVPLVLALGIGVSRVVSDGDGGGSGFGIVTLASLFPILAVLLLAFTHLNLDDYYGRPNSEAPVVEAVANSEKSVEISKPKGGFTQEEFDLYEKNGQVPQNSELAFRGNLSFQDGKIIVDDATIVLEKRSESAVNKSDVRIWDSALVFKDKLVESAIGAVRAILPLCFFLFLVLKVVLREKVTGAMEIGTGIFFALFGMALFTLGIFLALDPLGQQVGTNISASFSKITPYGIDGLHGPLFESTTFGQIVVILFAFALGYSATLAEPALNALGATVEKITIGAFKKNILMQSVAIGVGLGIAAGVSKLIFSLPLTFMLVPPYMLLMFLTLISSEDFVNFAWDSAGVTTGPITVPLVLAMGLGIGSSVGALEGFGVLAMASVFPIVTVLSVGLIVKRSNKKAEETAEEPA